MIKNPAMKTLKTSLAAAAVAMGALSAQASYDDLISTLEKNETLTAQEAADLRAKAPKYSVLPANKAVKELKIRGRVQVQSAYVDAENDEGSDDYSTAQIRRARIGLRGTLFDSVRAEIEANFVPGDSFSMRSAYLQWRQYKPAYVKFGFDKPRSSYEENTSSAEILTIERSVINGLVAAPGPLTGLSLDGSYSVLSYALGAYTDQLNANTSNQESEYLYNAKLALKLDSYLGEGNKLRLQGVYLTSDDPSGAVGSKADDVYTAAAHLGIKQFDLVAEYFLGDKDDVETKGFYVMPSMYLSKKLQAVARFEQSDSDKATGIRAPSRYLRSVPMLKVAETKDADGNVVGKVDPQVGDEYQAIYLGLNYYFSGHAHKVMLGVEFSELDNTVAGTLTATTLSAAWRMLF
jgi:phosphate-selective porin OprO and OprP